MVGLRVGLVPELGRGLVHIRSWSLYLDFLGPRTWYEGGWTTDLGEGTEGENGRAARSLQPGANSCNREWGI